MARRYAAFLSYSHRDMEVARWLHAALEAFPVPAALVGTPGLHGFVPQRIAPIFRDDDDLPATGDLSAEVTEALGDSDALIVICSEHAAQSAWVAEEVRRFKAQHGDRRVFAVLVHASDCHEPSAVMPLPLKRRVLSDGTVTSEPTEPLALALDGPDGRKAMVRRLAAGLLGVNLDALVQRDSARRQRHLRRVAAVLLVALLGTALLARSAILARDAAEVQRAEAEQLISFMLGDLRAQAEKSGRLDMLDAVAAQALNYYGRQELGDLSADSLAQRAKALHLIGETRMARGDYPAAGRALADASATTGELLARAPDDPQRIFDHAQSVYWEGDLARQRRDTAATRKAFTQYAALADRLVDIAPADPAWRAEVAHSRINMGVVHFDAGELPEASRAFRTAATIFRELAQGRDAGIEEQDNLATALAWSADADRSRGDIRAAIASRTEEAELRREMAKRDPTDIPALDALSLAVHAQSELAFDTGDAATARKLSAAAIRDAERATAVEPSNLRWAMSHWTMLRHRAVISGETDEREAPAIFARLRGATAELAKRDPDQRAVERRAAQAALAQSEYLARRRDPTAHALGEQAIEALARSGAGRDAVAAARLRLALANGSISDKLQPDIRTLTAKPARTLAEDCVLLAGYRAIGGDWQPLQARIAGAGYRRAPCVDVR